MSEVYMPPERPVFEEDRTMIFLAGSIEMGAAPDWQKTVSDQLADKNFSIMNPRRDDWDSSWVQDISHPQFNEQVTWELDYISVSDVVAFYFDPETKAPITLMELGYVAGLMTNPEAVIDGINAVVCCPPGYWRRGNVQIICKRHNILLVDTLDELVEVLRQLR